MLSGFSWERRYFVHISLCKHSEYCQVQLSGRICLPQSTPTPFNQLFRQLAGPSHLRLHIAHIISTGILTGSSIGCAVRLPLRPRLTLIRLALIRNPWSFGEGGSRPLYRYLYLHLLFQKLQKKSPFSLLRRWNAPLPMFTHPTASVNSLCPIIIHAKALD